MVTITKSDLADPELAVLEETELMPGAEVVFTSAREGTGLQELLAPLDRAAARMPGRAAAVANSDGAALHVDRAFPIGGSRGHRSTVAQSVARGDEVEVLPTDLRTRVRGVQVHDRPVERRMPASGSR